MRLKLQEDDFALVDDEEGSNSSIVNEADITRELELFRQQWYDEIHGQAEKSSDAGTRSKVHQLVVTSEPSDEDQVIIEYNNNINDRVRTIRSKAPSPCSIGQYH